VGIETILDDENKENGSFSIVLIAEDENKGNKEPCKITTRQVFSEGRIKQKGINRRENTGYSE